MRICLASGVRVTEIFCGSRVLLVEAMMRSRIWIKSSLERGLKRQISSKRFKNSGLNSLVLMRDSMSSSLNS